MVKEKVNLIANIFAVDIWPSTIDIYEMSYIEMEETEWFFGSSDLNVPCSVSTIYVGY